MRNASFAQSFRGQSTSTQLSLIVVAALLIRLILVAFVFRETVNPTDHFAEFGWEMGWLPGPSPKATASAPPSGPPAIRPPRLPVAPVAAALAITVAGCLRVHRSFSPGPQPEEPADAG